MKTKPDKQLVQYCEALMVLSVFSATCFGVSNIHRRPDLLSGTQRAERIGLYFSQPTHSVRHWRLDRYFRRDYQCYYQLFSP